jgi:thioredoxin-like negative regulator of GroEL
MSLKMLGQHNLAAKDCFSSLADLYDMWQRPDQAQAVRKQAVEVLQAALGPNHPAVMERRRALANKREPTE